MINRYLLLTLPDQVGDGDHVVAEQSLGQRVQRMRSQQRIEKEAGDHRVELHARDLNTHLPEHEGVELDVVPDLGR